MNFLARALLCIALLLLATSQTRSSLPELEGLWISDGYGLMVEFAPGELHIYELTLISCIATRTAKSVPEASDTSTSVFASGHTTIRISRKGLPEILRVRTEGTASDILLRRLTRRPDVCGVVQPNSPQRNYEIFWRTFAEQYPFFPLHHVDWHSTDKQFRPKVTDATSPTELFSIFQQMIAPLHDTHTGVEAEEIKQEFSGWRDDPNHLDEKSWNTAVSIIESSYLHSSLNFYCNRRIEFANLPNSLGYLRVTTFYGYADGGYASQVQCLQRSLDEIFGVAPNLKGLIVDVRLNEGGDDPLGIEIASRLTKRKYLAYTKAARNNGDLDLPAKFTEQQSTWVNPSKRPGFTGRVALLIGPDTVSAGETFTMALMGREPHVLRIGLNTQGVFSDVLNRMLLNGWRFHLPNEIYFTAKGKAFDAVGVPPDIRVPFFSQTDLQNGRDAALEAAIRELEH